MHVLIIDDDVNLQTIYRHILERDGFSVTVAASGREGLARLAEDAPDIVLLDRVLPDMDGADLCQKLKRHPTVLPPYVILLSALRTSEDDQIGGLERGADDYLTKPVSSRGLLARVHAAVRIKRAEAALRRTNVELIASEERFRNTFELANIGIAHVTPDGRFLRVNRHFSELLGRTQEELTGLYIEDITHPDDLPRSMQLLDEALSGRVDRFHLEKRYLRPDGSVVWADVTASLVRRPDGEPDYFIAALRDITRRRQMEERLAHSEAAFRALVEHSPDLISRVDCNLRHLYTSPATEHIIGLPPEAFIGKRTAEIEGVPKPLAEFLDAAIQEVFESGEEQRIEFSADVDGDIRHFESYLVPEQVGDGEIETVLAVTRDVTERVLLESEARQLATVLEQAQVGVVITDPTGVIRYANPHMERITGYKRDELVGQNPRILKSGHQPPSFYERLWQTITAGETWKGVFINRRKDGSLYYDESVIFPVYDRYGVLSNYAAVKQDITKVVMQEREREVVIAVSAALRHADSREQMLPAVGENMEALLDVDGVAFAMAMLNDKGGEAVIEWASGAFSGMEGTRFAPGQGVIGYVLATGEAFVTNDAPNDPQVHFRDRLGDVRAVVAVPMMAQHDIVGVLVVGRNDSAREDDVRILAAVADIAASAIRRADFHAATLRYATELEERVAERTRELAAANEELKSLEQMKSKFVSDVSHELRTPLASMELYLELLDQGKPEKQEAYREALHNAVQRLAQMVDDILDLAQLETEPARPRRLIPVDLNRIVEDEVQVHQQRAEAAGLELTYHLDPSCPQVLGDYNQLARMISALLLNAIKYTPEGQVHVQTRMSRNPDQVILLVEDTGIGIKETDLPHVFERFYRGDHGLLAIPGTGLGLSIAQEIVDLHGGRIEIESVEGEGTRVEVHLPVHNSSPQSQDGVPVQIHPEQINTP